MRLPVFFAKRYLFSKKSINAINIISSISVIGVLVSSAALVIVLSFYNGMENFILSQYSIFSPEYRIEPNEGKVFDPSNSIFNKIRTLKEIKTYSEVLEDKVLVQFGNKQFIGRIKGVEPESLHTHATEDMLLTGAYTVRKDSIDYAIIGAQVQANLQAPLESYSTDIELHIPRKGINPNSTLNPIEEINTRRISPSGILKFQPGYDDLIITSLSFAKDLLNEHNHVSAIEINTNHAESLKAFQKMIQKDLGKDYIVKNRQQQNPTLYKTIQSEKWMVFFIVTIIGIIAIFNIIGSLTMLVIDKKQDMTVLKSLGADNMLIQQIFFYEGVFIALLGSFTGIIIGLVFSLAQQHFGLVRTNGQMLFDAYPIDIRYSDFVLIFLTVMLVSILVSYASSKLSVRELGKLQLEDTE